VLVLERVGSSRFLPGYVVFPGGALDAADTELAAAWFGTGDEAARAAAVRELAEETGLALTRAGVRPAGEDPLGACMREPPEPGQLAEIAHWIAPEDVPVRFDARYFAVAASGELVPTPDAREAAAAWWARPAELLETWERAERKLYWPTLFTLWALAECRTAEELCDARIVTREPDDNELDRLPRSVFWQE
jgi:8-oxo-dGTP pyrophosphatase MutT (NUDIX family)